MIYAIRRGIYGEKTLVEFKSEKEMNQQNLDDPINIYSKCSATVARQWVMNGNPHETGLYVEDLKDRKVRYARPNP